MEVFSCGNYILKFKFQQESVVDCLQYVASEDDNKAVRDAAKEALDSLGCVCHDYEEVTKV